MNYEGFWYSKHEPHLPVPLEDDKAWKGKKLFLADLAKVEAKLRKNLYRGWSTCRCCGQRNGSGEYKVYDWTWPEGYRHYVAEHNVRPSLAFQMFIMKVDSIQALEKKYATV